MYKEKQSRVLGVLQHEEEDNKRQILEERYCLNGEFWVKNSAI